MLQEVTGLTAFHRNKPILAFQVLLVIWLLCYTVRPTLPSARNLTRVPCTEPHART